MWEIGSGIRASTPGGSWSGTSVEMLEEKVKMSAAGEPPAAATVGGQRWWNLLLEDVIVGLMVLLRLVVDLLRSAVIWKNL